MAQSVALEKLCEHVSPASNHILHNEIFWSHSRRLSSPTDSLDENKTMQECLICGDCVSARGDHVPVVIPCGHWMCKQCVLTLWAENNLITIADEKLQQDHHHHHHHQHQHQHQSIGFRCPFCRHLVAIKCIEEINELPVNGGVVAMTSCGPLQSSVRKCVECEDEDATTYCIPDDGFLCDHCFHTTHTSKVT